MGGCGEGGGQADGEHAVVGDVFDVLAQDVFVQTNHRAVFKQIFGPFFFLLGGFFEQLEAFVLQFDGDLRHIGIVAAAAHQVEHVLGAGQVQRFVAGDELDDFGVAFHQLALGKGKGAGEGNVKTDGFEHIDAHQAQIEFFLQLIQRHRYGFAVDLVLARAQQVVILGVFDQIVVIAGDVFGAGDDVFVLHDVVEHHGRVVDDIADNVGVAARMDGFEKRPGFNPGFQFGQRHQRQKADVGAAPLDGIEQGLVFQIADKDVFFVVGQVGVVDAVARNVDFFGTPEKGNLLFNQLFKDFVALLVVARHIDRLAEKHRLFECVVGFFAESAVLHHEMFAGHGGFP